MSTPLTTSARPARRRHRPGGSAVRLEDLHRSYGDVHALDGLTLDVAPGAWSPCSGRPAAARPRRCARSPASRTSTAGASLVGGRDITDVPASKRDMGMVFQAYSLFPHLTALRERRVRPADAARAAPASGAAAPARRSSSSGSRRSRSATPARCPAASSSGSRWPARWPSARGCCCSTSRCRPSTPRCGRSCARRSAGSSSRWARRPLRHPRPGGGPRRRRPGRGHARRPARAARRRRGSVYDRPATRVRRRVRRADLPRPGERAGGAGRYGGGEVPLLPGRRPGLRSRCWCVRRPCWCPGSRRRAAARPGTPPAPPGASCRLASSARSPGSACRRPADGGRAAAGRGGGGLTPGTAVTWRLMPTAALAVPA